MSDRYNPNDPTPKWIQEVGGHECPKHGRYYGSCASCYYEQKKQDERDTLTRLRREIDALRARVAELEAERDRYKAALERADSYLSRIQAAAGAPNPSDGCRVMLKFASEARLAIAALTENGAKDE